MNIDLSQPVTQAEFGAIVGVSQQAISDFAKTCDLPDSPPLGYMLRAYLDRLREQAESRLATGGLDLTQERALLAREYRIAHARKNAEARAEFAPTVLLTEVLGIVSTNVAARIGTLGDALRRACPTLPHSALATIDSTIESAQNEWIRATAKFTVDPAPADETNDMPGPDANDDGVFGA